MMTFRDKVTKELLERFPIEKAKQYHNSKYSFYYEDYNDNLFCALGDDALAAYKNGSGGETKETVKEKNGVVWTEPPKMASIVSSSAMTFNLLGNETIVIPEDYTIPSTNESLPHVIPAGTYTVRYEKQFFTVNKGSNPANLDAFLYCKATNTAIFCEMKTLEWLGEPGTLKDSYLDENSYFKSAHEQIGCDEKAFSIFEKLIDQMTASRKPDPNKKDHDILVSMFDVYDAWQMLKHTLAIYNYTSAVTKESVNNFKKGNIQSIAGLFNNIFLLNVVNEVPEEWIADTKTRTKYIERLDKERSQAHMFISIMMDHKNGLPRLFDNNCNASFQMAYISAKDFSEIFAMSETKRKYLKRYFN